METTYNYEIEMENYENYENYESEYDIINGVVNEIIHQNIYEIIYEYININNNINNNIINMKNLIRNEFLETYLYLCKDENLNIYNIINENIKEKIQSGYFLQLIEIMDKINLTKLENITQNLDLKKILKRKNEIEIDDVIEIEKKYAKLRCF